MSNHVSISGVNCGRALQNIDSNLAQYSGHGCKLTRRVI
jgi:hypothetical protein